MEGRIQPVKVPLLEAVIEVRFPGEARIEVCRAEYQDLIRADFPELAVALANPAQAPPMQHYRFVNAAGTEFVGLAVNSFVHSTREYPGWERFRDRTRELWELIPSFKPRSITHVGVRYVNQFEGDMLDNIIFDPKNNLYGPILEKPELHRGQTVLVAGEGRLTVNIEYAEYAPTKKRVKLDFDCVGETPNVDGLWELVEDLHSAIESRFFEVLTPEYRQALLPMGGSNGSA